MIRRAAEQDNPFCLSISFKAPHKPATPDPRFDDIYAGKAFAKPANFGREHAQHLSPQSKFGRQYPRFHEWKYDSDYDSEMAKYHQQVYAIDVAVGMIRDELAAQGIADNTVVVFTSDNGYICGSHGYGSKVLPMEESSRVPLIVYAPGCPLNGSQHRCQRLTANIDFAPTILEMAGVDPPASMDGKSLLGLLDGAGQGGHEQVAFVNVFGPLATRLSSQRCGSSMTRNSRSGRPRPLATTATNVTACCLIGVSRLRPKAISSRPHAEWEDVTRELSNRHVEDVGVDRLTAS